MNFAHCASLSCFQEAYFSALYIQSTQDLLQFGTQKTLINCHLQEAKIEFLVGRRGRRKSRDKIVSFSQPLLKKFMDACIQEILAHFIVNDTKRITRDGAEQGKPRRSKGKKDANNSLLLPELRKIVLREKLVCNMHKKQNYW